MKNLKKWIALALAAAMCMGLGMTALASNTDSPEEIPPLYGAVIKDANGTTLGYTNSEELSKEVEEFLSDDKNLIKILEDNNYPVPDDVDDIKVIAARDLKLPEDFEIPKGGMKLEVGLVNGIYWDANKHEYVPYDLSEDDTVYVLHQKANGVWEVLEAEVKDGRVIFTINSLSPVAIVKVMSNGKVVTLQKNESTGQLEPAKPSKSPATGE